MTAAIRTSKSRVTSSSCVVPIVVALLVVAVLSISFIYEFHQPSVRSLFLSEKFGLNHQNGQKPVVTRVIWQHHVSKGTPEVPEAVTSPLQPFNKKYGAFDLHFIHIPKCGGTSMTAILRDVACTIDHDRNNDCCTNPGYCDWHDNRRCKSIKGCTDHFPLRRFIYKPMPSITMLREPVSRLISAYFYRGHSPNNDYFHVRPEFKEIRQGLRPKVKFDEYIEMAEYQNIQTRMLGADSFPYRNVTVNQEIFDLAVDALDHIFFVGLQEEYDVSVKVLLQEFNIEITTTISKERDQQRSKSQTRNKAALRKNKRIVRRAEIVNSYDMQLYKLGVEKFCRVTGKYPELYDSMQQSTKDKCSLLLNA